MALFGQSLQKMGVFGQIRASQQIIEFGHCFIFCGIHDVDVWLHGLVIAEAGPFHDNAGGDAHGERVYNEGTAAGMCMATDRWRC